MPVEAIALVIFHQLWQGIVEEFALIGHPKATTCYAWSYRDGDRLEVVTVLALPPVDSPENAVKAVVAAEAREQRFP